GDALERRALRFGRVGQRLEDRLGPLVRGAQRMEPQRHLALAEAARHALTEADLALGDRLAAAAALGAPGGRGFVEMGHVTSIHANDITTATCPGAGGRPADGSTRSRASSIAGPTTAPRPSNRSPARTPSPAACSSR